MSKRDSNKLFKTVDKGFSNMYAVYDKEKTSPCLNTMGGGGRQPMIIDNQKDIPLNTQNGQCRCIKANYQQSSPANFQRQSTFGSTGATDGLRIRKLTPRECFRLMGVKDEDFDKLQGMSNSTLYHLAGDSIVTTVLMAIFGELLEVEWKEKVEKLHEKGNKKD